MRLSILLILRQEKVKQLSSALLIGRKVFKICFPWIFIMYSIFSRTLKILKCGSSFSRVWQGQRVRVLFLFVSFFLFSWYKVHLTLMTSCHGIPFFRIFTQVLTFYWIFGNIWPSWIRNKSYFWKNVFLVNSWRKIKLDFEDPIYGYLTWWDIWRKYDVIGSRTYTSSYT